jgi:hypothetical protein
MVYIERAVLDPMGRQLFANTLTTEEPSTAQVALTEQAVLALTALRSCADHIRYTRNDREWIEGRASVILEPRASLAGRIFTVAVALLAAARNVFVAVKVRVSAPTPSGLVTPSAAPGDLSENALPHLDPRRKPVMALIQKHYPGITVFRA